MSTTVTSSDLRSADVPAAERPPGLSRLVDVELRKAVDTRAGFWLLAVTGLLSCVVVVLRLSFGDRSDKDLDAVVALAQAPVNALVPVIGILLVTSEWSQRGALTTFTLVPHRARVISAKLLATVVLAVTAAVAAVVAAIAGFAVGAALGLTSGGWHLSGAMIPQLLVVQLLGMLMGAAFGLLLLNSAAAIVLYFVLPTVWSVLGQIVTALKMPAEWLDTGRTSAPLFESAALTTQQWEQLGTSYGLWLVVPMVLGLWRLRRKEIA